MSAIDAICMCGLQLSCMFAHFNLLSVCWMLMDLFTPDLTIAGIGHTCPADDSSDVQDCMQAAATHM